MDELNDAARRGDTGLLYELLDRDPCVLHGMDNITIIETPLHIAASVGNTLFAMEVVMLKPSFAWKLNTLGLSPMRLALHAEDVTVQLETAVHIAVKRVQLRVLFGWLLRINREDVLKWKDIDGNTVLHIATFSSQLQVVKMLVKYVENTKNCDNMTALDIYMEKRRPAPG
ncbi:hypothetical protein CDL15_Pgr021477 [Punica granatum]|uniref:Uncharacterized protein n=1 Tax=Punica granatum TaxID=22663 RepID=A0A218XPH0_PUNGR|nr:hypothetical protein CDL15_Pgr021477 [Punica granatum]